MTLTLAPIPKFVGVVLVSKYTVAVTGAAHLMVTLFELTLVPIMSAPVAGLKTALPCYSASQFEPSLFCSCTCFN